VTVLRHARIYHCKPEVTVSISIVCLSAVLGAVTLAWLRERRRLRSLAARYAGLADAEREEQRIREALAREQRDAADALARERRNAAHELARESARASAERAHKWQQATGALAGEQQRLTDEIAELQRQHAVFAEMHATRMSLLEAEYRTRSSLHERLQRQVVLLQDTIVDLSLIKAELAGEDLAEGSGPTLCAPTAPEPWLVMHPSPTSS
jgi:Skp family chaperone for outer membrane proteins